MYQHEMLWVRQLEQENKMWSTPALALTAQAFLFSVALAPESSLAARLLTSTLAIAVAFASFQLMAKHWHLGQLDSLRLRDLEHLLEVHPLSDRTWDTREWRDGKGLVARPHAYVRWKSRVIWQWLIATFGVAAAGVIVAAILAPGVFRQ